MINIYRFIFKAYKTPRYFIHIINVKMSQLLNIVFFTLCFSATIFTLLNYPIFKKISEDVNVSTKYIPEFTYNQGELQLGENEKPLYYQSDTFNFIIDDTISSSNLSTERLLEEEKLAIIEQDKLLQLYLTKDHIYFLIGRQLYEFQDANQFVGSRSQLIQVIDTIINNKWVNIFIQWLTFFIISLISYGIHLLILTLFSRNVNQNLSKPLTFYQRFKLAIAITSIPYLLLVMFQQVNVSLVFSLLVLGFVFLTILNQTLKDHTKYIQEIHHLINHQKHDELTTFVDYFEELKYIPLQENIPSKDALLNYNSMEENKEEDKQD